MLHTPASMAWAGGLASFLAILPAAYGQPVCPTMLLASDAAAGDQFGSSVGLEETVALVGAPYDDDGGLDSGAAYVLTFDGTAWLEEQKLAAADGATRDYFGLSVDVGGVVAVVGAPFDDDDGPSSGSAYVFRHDGAAWVEEQKLTPPGFAANGWFGAAVAIDGDTIAVGAPASPYAPTESGSVYVFEYQGGSWVFQQRLLPADAAEGQRLGISVDLDYGVLVAGASGDDELGNAAGAAYVFAFDGTAWVQDAKLLAADGTAGDQFGHSVAVSSAVAIVGAHTADAGATESGTAYAFRWNGSAWQQESKLLLPEPVAFDRFGGSVAVEADTAIIGSLRYGAGRAETFRYGPSGWSHAQSLRNPLADESADVLDGFGASVALYGDVALIGVRRADLLCTDDALCNSGAVYAVTGLSEPDCNANGIPDVCEAQTDCNSNGVQDICDVAAGTSDDCNGNEIPDECLELEEDCNGNEIPDACDLADGTSEDCNANDMPDECDLESGFSEDCDDSGTPDECESDCNSNGLHDACDLLAGTSQDCNSSGLPDECEQDCNENGLHDSCDIAAGTSVDCTGDGVPDECEPDCNSNGVADSCDIDSGASADCNGNDIPDECDAAPPGADCNSNAVPDECEADCNENGVPDACDLASGTSTDCSGNGVPDECEPDCNQNGLTDSCEIADGLSPDCDGNGVPDECAWGQQVRVAAFDPGVVGGGGRFVQDEWLAPVGPTGPDAFEEFGRAVSIDGDRLLVGAFNDENGGHPYFAAGFGAAYVYYHEDGGTPLDPQDDAWVPEAKLTAADGEEFDRFGFAVSLSGARAAIGSDESDAIGEAGDEVFSPGAVYVYARQDMAWIEEARLTAPDAEHFDAFGMDVALDGDDLAVANPFDDDDGLNSGSVYVFRWTGQAWEQEAKLTASDASAGQKLGRAIALAGDFLVAAADDGVYVYRKIGPVWSEVQKLLVSATDVALDGDTLVVGDEDGGGDGSGLVSIFRWDGLDWLLEAELSPAQGVAGDAFGSSVDLDGDLAVIGARQRAGAAAESGAAYVFRRQGTDWTEEAILLPDIGSAGDELGTAVSIAAGHVAVGAPGEHEGGDHAGAAYVFVPLDVDSDGIPDACQISCPPDATVTPTGRWLYWTDLSGDLIQRARPDGASRETVMVGTISPADLVVHAEEGRMYWTESDSGWIKRAYLDGSCAEPLVQVTDALGEPLHLRGLALDAEAGKLYWAAYSHNVIQRADLDGTGLETLRQHDGSTRGFVGISLDLDAGWMYWAESIGDRIMRARLVGSEEEVVVHSGVDGTQGPYYLALHKCDGWLYWTEFATGRIRRARLDGTGAETVYTEADGHPIGLTLDLARSRLSWSLLDGRIRQIDLDGTGTSDVVTDLTGPWGLAVSPTSQGYELEDYADINQCLAGPGALPDPAGIWTVDDCLSAFDIDLDQDVDLKDLASIARSYYGY